jgi:hypothetical protein
VDLAITILSGWVKDKKNVGALVRRGLHKELLSILSSSSTKFVRKTGATVLEVLRAFAEASKQATRMLADLNAWTVALGLLEGTKATGAALAALATPALDLVALTVQANEQAAAIRLDHAAGLRTVFKIVKAMVAEPELALARRAVEVAGLIMKLATTKGAQTTATTTDLVSPEDFEAVSPSLDLASP